MPVIGRVIDIGGQVISDPKNPMEVTLAQTYGKECMRLATVPVVGGYFESGLYLMNDERNFKTKVKLNAGPEFLKIE